MAENRKKFVSILCFFLGFEGGLQFFGNRFCGGGSGHQVDGNSEQIA